MRTRIRMESASFTLCTQMVRDLDAPMEVAMAQLVDLEGEDGRELIVVPIVLRGGRDPGSIPVYFHSAPNAVRVMDQLRLFDRRRLVRPSVLVAHSRRGTTRACWYPAEGGVHGVQQINLVGSRPQSLSMHRRLMGRWDREEGRWSRTVGGLGGDAGALWRLQNANYAVLGCGRNGALVATHLASLGVRGRIWLIDDDHVEEHNVPAMGLDSGWVAAPKVKAVEHLFRRMNLEAEVQTVEAPATSRQAIRAMAVSDFILCSVDHGEARLVAAATGAAYLRPVLDVGSGVRFDWRGRWEAGFDVRLTPPGRCLVCFGGVDNLVDRRRAQWWEERAGSLRSLNSVATGFAQTLLERYFSSDGPTGPIWLHGEIRDHGGVRTRTIRNPRTSGACPVCVRLGFGDLMFEPPSADLVGGSEELDGLPF